MANKPMKTCSSLLAIREMQIKTTVRYRYIPIEMAKIKNSDIKCWWGCGYINMQLPYNPAIALLSIYLREIKTYIHVKSGT